MELVTKKEVLDFQLPPRFEQIGDEHRKQGRSIASGRILIQAGAAKGFQIVFTLSILFDRHLVCDPGE